jgi:uncharacterized protein
MSTFIGRQKELERLQRIKQSNTSEFVAIYGRRRVGKTLLVRHFFEDKFSFQVTGVAHSSLKSQLKNFQTELVKQNPTIKYEPPANWFDAFQNLIKHLEGLSMERKVIFFDELPWFDTYKSDFVPSLEHFWNSWASVRKDIILVCCGSAASWMINKLINHRGGLHNRVTERILVMPFTLREAEALLRLKNPTMSRYHTIQLYMVMGGIPFYLNAVRGEFSAAQNIESICFAPDGLLRMEFGNLFHALFSKAERHIAVVEAIATKTKGLTRAEILEITGLTDGGSITRLLDELEKSGFIRKYTSFDKRTRNSLYQLVDFYTLFYIRFIKNSNAYDVDNWINAIDTPSYRAWSGYAYEQICLYHLADIKKALGITGVVSHSSSWISITASKGAQIDLVIDRRDQVVNLCEMKFSTKPFTITKAYAEQLQNKIQAFEEETKTRKSIFLTMITTYGLVKNNWSSDLVRNDLDMNIFFD